MISTKTFSSSIKLANGAFRVIINDSERDISFYHFDEAVHYIKGQLEGYLQPYEDKMQRFLVGEQMVS